MWVDQVSIAKDLDVYSAVDHKNFHYFACDCTKSRKGQSETTIESIPFAALYSGVVDGGAAGSSRLGLAMRSATIS
jgi:hypothetical protein